MLVFTAEAKAHHRLLLADLGLLAHTAVVLSYPQKQALGSASISAMTSSIDRTAGNGS